MRPAPTSVKARALSRGQADLGEVDGEEALAQAPAVERDRHRLQQRAERHHQEGGARPGAGCARPRAIAK